MPVYTTVVARMASYGQAAALLEKLRQIFKQCQEVSAELTLYNAATNTDFNEAIDSIFNEAERTELAVVLTDVQLLVTTWTAQHSVLLGPPVP